MSCECDGGGEIIGAKVHSPPLPVVNLLFSGIRRESEFLAKKVVDINFHFRIFTSPLPWLLSTDSAGIFNPVRLDSGLHQLLAGGFSLVWLASGCGSSRFQHIPGGADVDLTADKFHFVPPATSLTSVAVVTLPLLKCPNPPMVDWDLRYSLNNPIPIAYDLRPNVVVVDKPHRSTQELSRYIPVLSGSHLSSAIVIIIMLSHSNMPTEHFLHGSNSHCSSAYHSSFDRRNVAKNSNIGET